jgi:proteasome component ECM29
MHNSLRRYASIDHADPTRSISLINASGVLLAASTSGAGHKSESADINLGPARLQCVESLFNVLGSAVHRKDDELSLPIGEALVKYADAIGFGDWSLSSKLTEGDGPYDDTTAHSLPPHKHILYTIFKREIVASNPIKKTGCSAVLLAITSHASRLSHLDASFHSRMLVKEVVDQLQKIQYAFIQLLKDPKSKHLARESCCRGLAACRGLSLACQAGETMSDKLDDLLLKAFGQTSNYGRSAMMESEEQARERRNQDGRGADLEQTEVGGASGVSESALGAYREMSNSAMISGRPDILYTLVSWPYWPVFNYLSITCSHTLFALDDSVNKSPHLDCY